MLIEKLTLNSIRNIEQFSVDVNQKCNVIYGANGSGKTSILEAISLLGFGRSFRTNKHTELIQSERTNLTVMTVANLAGIQHKFGIRKSVDADNQIRIDGKTIRKQSELSSFFPIVSCNPLSIQLIDGSPSVRRKFIDWIVFHVEHAQVSTLYKDYERVLDQRNKSLKLKDKALVKAWDSHFLQLNDEISRYRETVINELSELIGNNFRLLANENVATKKKLTINYKKGWNDKFELSDVLNQQLDSDLKRNTTQSGIHRDDLQITIDGIAVKQYLSRGEVKILVVSLLLAAEQYIRAKTNKNCIWLIDDIAAELDQATIERLFEYITQTDNQLFITCVEKDLAYIQNKLKCKYTMFHVKHGKKIN